MTKRTIHSKDIFQRVKPPEDYCPPIIIAYALKTPENMGNIIRLADNVDCKKVIFVDINQEIRLSKIKKTASSSYNSVNWEFCSEKELKSLGVKIPKVEILWIDPFKSDALISITKNLENLGSQLKKEHHHLDMP